MPAGITYWSVAARQARVSEYVDTCPVDGRVTHDNINEPYWNNHSMMAAYKAGWLKNQGRQDNVWHVEDEHNLKAALGYIEDEYLRRWFKDIVYAKFEKQVNIPHFTYDDILALQCAMKTTEKADNELYEQLKSLHDRIHDAYLLEKQE